MKKKGLFRITAAALMTAMAISVIPSISSAAYTETKATIVPASAKIRESAGSSSNVLGSAVKGTEVTIVDEAKDDAGTLWYKVNVNGNTGYIRSDLVTAAAADSADSADNSDAKADDSKADDAKATDTKTTDTKATDTKADDTQKTTTATNTATTIDGTQIDLTAITLPDGVTGADAQYIIVNVTNGKIRSDASTKADIVDTLVKGSTLVSLGTKSDDSGKSWYYTVFTGNDGSQKNGYIRSDLITAGDVLPKADTTETTEATETTEETTAAEANNDYQLVYADDGSGSGTSTWFLYDNKNGTRMKADELMEYVSAQPAKEKENETALKQYRMIIIILGVVAIAFLIGLIILGIKLREADYEYDPDDDDDDDDRPERPRRSATGRDDTRRDGGDREDDDRRRMRESEDRSRRRMQADAERSKRKDSDDDDVRPLRRSRVSEDRPVRRIRDDEDRPRRPRDEEEERPARRVRQRDDADRSARSRDDADRPVRTRDNTDRPARTRDDEERPVRTRENSDISRASRESDAHTRRSSYDDQDAEDQAGTENSRARKARNFISDETDDLDFEFINVDDKNDK